MIIKNWNGDEIEVAESRGGVIATSHPFDNVVSTGVRPWPPIELIQKCVQSRHEKGFSEENARICIAGLGYYSDLQSLHSEDALTWSVFGTISRADIAIRAKWVLAFFDLLSLECTPSENTEVALWRRIPHPEKPIGESNGPELDFAIFTDAASVFGEAKWRAKVATNQGVSGKKSQMELREEFFDRYVHSIYPDITHQDVVGVCWKKEMLYSTAGHENRNPVATWDDVCSLKEHPNCDELIRYLSWKKDHSKQP
ncbi:MAG: hypothetical protein HN368_10520 [Spirochaetales bacterium]|jgi:hypothetical protein|nr:hypothetical protein [Spirochaetales bacterium]